MKNPIFKAGVRAGTHHLDEPGVERTVKIKNLRSPQHAVDEKKVNKLARFTKNMPGTPTVSHLGGGIYTTKDGNHRIAAAIKQGKRVVKVKVQRFSANTTDSPPRADIKPKLIPPRKKKIQFGVGQLIRNHPKTAIGVGVAAGVAIGATGYKAAEELHKHAWNDHQPERGARSPEEIAAHYKKIYPTAYLSGSSALKIGIPGSSDVDVHIPTRSVASFKRVERKLLKTLSPSAYYKPGYDHAGFTGKMDGRPIDVAVTYGEKGFKKRDAIRRVASTMTDEERQQIIATKQKLKSAWVAPEARYHAYKRGLDIKHGIPLWRAEKLPQEMASQARIIRFDDDLQEHQRRVIRRIQNPDQSGLVVAHGLGSGKTRTAIEAHRALGGEADVVLPAALRANYQKETEKWGGPEANVMSQQALSLKGSGALKHPLLIVDEAHRARNPRAKLSEAIKDSPAQKRLLLTGTPSYNNPADLATLVNQAAGKPVLREGKAFQTRYLQPGMIDRWRGKRLSNEGELKKVLNKYVDYHKGDPSMLPEVKSRTIPVTMGKHQSELYRASQGRIPPGMKMHAENIERLAPYLTGARQVSNTSSALNPKSREEPKIDRAFTDLQEHLKNPKGKALVYSNWLKHGIGPMQRRLDESKTPYGIFTGNEPMKQRAQTVRDYNEGKHRALLVSSSGAEGLDLKGTRMVQILEPHFNNAKIRQVVGRSARMGSHTHLPPEDRNVEVRQYLARPRNRFLPGSSKGVEDMLAEAARKKDEVDRQITSLLHSRMKLIRFDRPEERRTKATQKRATNLLRGSQWETDSDLRGVRKAIQSKADPKFVTYKKGRRIATSRVVEAGTDAEGRPRHHIIEPSHSGLPERHRGVNPATLPGILPKYPQGDFKKGEAYEKASKATKHQHLPPYKEGFGHYASDWRDTEAFHKARLPVIKARVEELKAKGAKAPSGTAKQKARAAKAGETDPLSEEFRKESAKLSQTPEQLREAMAKPRQAFAKELGTRKEIAQQYNRRFVGGRAKPLTNWTGKATDIAIPSKTMNKAMENLDTLVPKVQERWAKRRDRYIGALRKRAEKNLTPPPAQTAVGNAFNQATQKIQKSLGMDEANAKIRNIIEPIERPPAPKGGLPTLQPSEIKQASKDTAAQAVWGNRTQDPAALRKKFEKAQERLARLSSPAGEQSERIIKRRLIRSGEVFKDIPKQAPELPSFNPMTKKRGTLIGTGIAAGVIGAGLLARKLMKKPEERKQLMSSRLIPIRFGWKPTPYAEHLLRIRSVKKPTLALPWSGAAKVSDPGMERGLRIQARRAAEKAEASKIPHLDAGGPKPFDPQHGHAMATSSDYESNVIRAARSKLEGQARSAGGVEYPEAVRHADVEKLANVKAAKATKEAAKVKAAAEAAMAQQAAEHQVAKSAFEQQANAAANEKIKGIQSGVRKKVAIGVAAGTGLGAIGGWRARRPEETTQFAMKSKLIRLEEKKRLSPAATMGISAGITGALVAGIPTALKRGSTIKGILKAAGGTGATLGGLGAASALIGNKIVGDPSPGENAAYTKRAAIGGAVGGAILGTAAGGLAIGTKRGRNLAEALSSWRPVSWALKGGAVRGAAVGGVGAGGYGAYQGVDEGSGVDALHGVKTKRMSSRLRPIQLAAPNEVWNNQGLTGRVATDRFKKKIEDADKQDRDANLARSMGAGAALGAISKWYFGGLRNTKMPLLKRAGIGAGAGAAASLLVRKATDRSKDIYGDRSHDAKGINTLPQKALLGGAAVIGGLRLKRHFFHNSAPLIQFKSFEDKWLGDKVNTSRRAEDLQTYYKRTQGFVRDISGAVKGEKPVDERGRPRKQEWDKPYVKKAVAAGILGIGLLSAGKISRMAPGFTKGTAMHTTQELWKNRVPHKVIAAKFPKTAEVYTKVRDFVKGYKSDVTSQGAAVVGGDEKSLLGRVNKWLIKEHGAMGGKPPTPPPQHNIVAGPGTTPEELKKLFRNAEKDEAAAAIANQATKSKNTLLSSRAHAILFSEDTVYADKWEHWVRNRPGVIKRNREKKSWWKRSENQPLIQAGLVSGTAIGTAYATRKFAPEAFKMAKALSSTDPILTLSAKLDQLLTPAHQF